MSIKTMRKTKAEDIAYYNGSDAAERGAKRNENPYDPSYYLHKCWDHGWVTYHEIMKTEDE